MKRINFRSLRSSSYRLAETKEVNAAIAQDAIVNDIIKKVKNKERVYVAITQGKHAGAIAYIKRMPENSVKTNKYVTRNSGDDSDRVRRVRGETICSVNLILGFDVETTSIKANLFDQNCELLLDFTGKTVFTANRFVEAEAEAAKNLKSFDMRGKELIVGDLVVYINSRYAAGLGLNFGTVTKIKHKAVDNTSTGKGDRKSVV